MPSWQECIFIQFLDMTLKSPRNKEFAKHFDSGILHRFISNGVFYEEMGKNICLILI
jgi:hypothetical protein